MTNLLIFPVQEENDYVIMKKMKILVGGMMMNNKMKIMVSAVLMITVLCVLTFKAGVMVGAADNEPGSVGDPLVSKSYLDSRLDGLSGVMTKVTLSKGSVLVAAEGASAGWLRLLRS